MPAHAHDAEGAHHPRLVLRATATMPSLFLLHLGLVPALSFVLPWSRFARAFFRPVALLRDAVERRTAE